MIFVPGSRSRNGLRMRRATTRGASRRANANWKAVMTSKDDIQGWHPGSGFTSAFDRPAVPVADIGGYRPRHDTEINPQVISATTAISCAGVAVAPA
ncbi:MAG: hypothetical protein WA006_00680, partial [Rhodoglobus sp.]